MSERLIPPRPSLAYENPEEFKKQMDVYLERVRETGGAVSKQQNGAGKDSTLSEEERKKRIGKILDELRLFGQTTATPEELRDLGVTFADLTHMLFYTRMSRDDDF